MRVRSRMKACQRTAERREKNLPHAPPRSYCRSLLIGTSAAPRGRRIGLGFWIVDVWRRNPVSDLLLAEPSDPREVRMVQRDEAAILRGVRESLLPLGARRLLINVEFDRDRRVFELCVGCVDRISPEDELLSAVFQYVESVTRSVPLRGKRSDGREDDVKGAVGAGPAQAKTATIGSAYFVRLAVI
jgi:hypothetical protein